VAKKTDPTLRLDLKEYFRRIGKNVRDLFRDQVFVKGKDIDDAPFRQYTPAYAKLKQSGKLFRAGASVSTAPIASGDLSRDFGSHFKISERSLEIGWSVHGRKIGWLRDMDRNITKKDEPFTKSIRDYILSSFKKEIKRQNPDKVRHYKIRSKK